MPAGRSSFGTVTNAGRAVKDMTGMSQRGQGGKNTVSGGASKPNPAPTIRGMRGQVKGPDKGTGTGG